MSYPQLGGGATGLVLAEAQAKARIAAADGEARAIRVISDALRRNPAYVRWYEATRWNGVLPRYVAGKAGRAGDRRREIRQKACSAVCGYNSRHDANSRAPALRPRRT